jgi:hypothetical protein
MTDFFKFIDEHGIAYARYDHPAVYTVEEADQLVPDLPGAKTKNLFIPPLGQHQHPGNQKGGHQTLSGSHRA